SWALRNIKDYLAYLDQRLSGKDYLTGKTFTVADSYCFVVVGWAKGMDIPLTPYKNLQAYLARVSQRPAVHKVLQEEGLLE
ncbi:MAG: glutathione S-transferase family protein, partial [Bdellovibrionia bacterium]